ncbi:hypothetical protein EHS25_007973 [Saitozyma podzolica]|uniref:Uncharacterized protein n=1 Tax=Saitozyma podzolica TaxID=1890683 RepID=A0A427XLC2_9TREE|nr:hypothetical protein EHS25_007973 [Saitozyma podzolica]
MPTAESATSAAFPALMRVTGRFPGHLRAQDPRRNVAGADTGRRQRPNLFPVKLGGLDLILQDLRPSGVRSRFPGFTDPPSTPSRPGHRHNQIKPVPSRANGARKHSSHSGMQLPKTFSTAARERLSRDGRTCHSNIPLGSHFSRHLAQLRPDMVPFLTLDALHRLAELSQQSALCPLHDLPQVGDLPADREALAVLDESAAEAQRVQLRGDGDLVPLQRGAPEAFFRPA